MVLQLLPTGVHVSIAYPPDTDTPGYANENTTKVTPVLAAPVQPGVLLHLTNCVLKMNDQRMAARVACKFWCSGRAPSFGRGWDDPG